MTYEPLEFEIQEPATLEFEIDNAVIGSGIRTWTELEGKPFETLGSGLVVTSGVLSTNSYSRSEVDTALNLKADKSTTYTKTEVDTALSGKQNTLTPGTRIAISNNVISTSASEVSVSAQGTSSTQIGYITVNGTEYQLAGASGVVTSVNGQTGVVELDAEDVGALPSSTVIPTSAGEISYDNPTYNTVKKALDKLLYVSPVITAFSGGGTYENGQSISTINFAWAVNKTVTSQSINNGVGSIQADIRAYAYTPASPITSSITYILTVGDGTNTAQRTTALNFYNKKYYGVSENTTLTDAQIIALSSEWATSRTWNKTFNCSGGKYFYLIIPTNLCTNIQFKVGGLSFSDMNVVTRNVVNASGATVSYNIYRPNNIQTGTAIQVEVL